MLAAAPSATAGPAPQTLRIWHTLFTALADPGDRGHPRTAFRCAWCASTTPRRSIPIVTHDPRIAERCDRVISVVDGVIASDARTPAAEPAMLAAPPTTNRT